MIACIEAVGLGVKTERELNAVALEVVDEHAGGFSTLLGPASAQRLAVQLGEAVGELEGLPSERARLAEAQRLLKLLRAGGMRSRQVARQIGVSDSTVSMWLRNKQAPTVDRLAALRRLACTRQ